MNSFCLTTFLALVSCTITTLALPLERQDKIDDEGPSTPPITAWSRCDVSHSGGSDNFISTIRLLHQTHTDGSARQKRQDRTDINTYVHIVSDIASVRAVNKSTVLDQMDTLNTVYNPIGFYFNLQRTTLTVDDAWAAGTASAMDAAKQNLREGTYADLNLYFHTSITGNNLGTCTFPSALPKGVDAGVYAMDGCSMHAGTMPGGWVNGFNSGLTAVHEVGHWLGLLHTFEGESCSGEGDHIADTRQERLSTDGCPTSPAKNTCPELAGVDPIHNYMDYSIDDCYESFSTLQVDRMHNLWQLYRKSR